MSALSLPRRVASLAMQGVDFAASSIGRAGLGAFAWPIAIAVGLGTGIFGLVHPEFVASVTARRATMDWMFPALFGVAVSLVGVIASALIIAWLRKRRTGAPKLATYTRVLQCAAVLAALPLVAALRLPLTPRREWLGLVFIGITAALFTYSAYKCIPERGERAGASRLARIIALVVLGGIAVAFVLRVSAAGIANHLSFNTGRVDLGFYVSRFREASQGHLFGCSLCGSGRHPYEHFEPIIVFFAPVYAVDPSAQTLIVLQSVVIASGAVAVFFLARGALGNLSALLLGVAYLAYPPLLEIALFDFHAIAFAIPLSLFLLLALHAGRTRTYLALAVLLLLVREDMGFVLATVGLYAVATNRPKLGWATIALAVVALVVMHFAAPSGVLQPLREVFGELTVRRRKAHPPVAGEMWLGAVQRLFDENKVTHAVELLSPLLFLSVLSRGRVLLLYGSLMILAAPSSLPQSPNAHETALVIPFLFALAVWALGDVLVGRVTWGTASRPKLERALTLGILVSSLLQCYLLGPFFRDAPFRAGPRDLGRSPEKEQIALDRDLHKLSVSWPKGVKVAASGSLLPHLGGASHLYALDDRDGTDYVVASMKHRLVARHMDAEEKERQLEAVATFGDVRVYRTHYGARLQPQARHLDDE